MPFNESVDSSVAMLQLDANQAGVENVQNAVRTKAALAITGDSSGKFDGSIGDLKRNYPEVYNKLVLQSIAYQIVIQCQHANDRLIEEMKRQRQER